MPEAEWKVQSEKWKVERATRYNNILSAFHF